MLLNTLIDEASPKCWVWRHPMAQGAGLEGLSWLEHTTVAQILAEAPSGAVTTANLTAELMLIRGLSRSCAQCGQANMLSPQPASGGDSAWGADLPCLRLQPDGIKYTCSTIT